MYWNFQVQSTIISKLEVKSKYPKMASTTLYP